MIIISSDLIINYLTETNDLSDMMMFSSVSLVQFMINIETNMMMIKRMITYRSPMFIIQTIH